MTTPTITQIIERLQSNIFGEDQAAIESIKSLTTEQQLEAMRQFQRLCAQANTNLDGVALTKYARAMFTSARISRDEVSKAVAFYYSAVAEYHQKNYDECISRLERTLQEIDRIPREQSQNLLANIHYLYASTFLRLHKYAQAKQYADSALALYQQQNNQASIANTRNLIQQISEDQAIGTPQASSDEMRIEWQQIKAELLAAQEELRRVRTHIAQHTDTRDALIRQIETTQQHHNEQRDQLAQAYAIAQQQHNDALVHFEQQQKQLTNQRQQAIQQLEHDITQITQQRENQLAQFNHDIESRKATISDYDSQIVHLRERARVWQMVEHMPFWLAIIKHEMAQQRISTESIDFLQKLYTLAPQEALATLVEVEARSGKTPHYTYNLDTLHGEVRLFAATANARKLKETDDMAAVSHVVDAWEFFLKETK
jgi:tetratricopeptide (TPR) repeat protein